MKAGWTRTSFRVKPEAHQKLRELSERSGCKLKEFLDETIKRSARSGLWRVEPDGKLADSYLECVELQDADRVTFEVSAEAMGLIGKIVEDHPDLNRDQVLSVILFTANHIYGFPLRAERKKLAKLRPQIKRLLGLSKMIDRELRKQFPDGHLVFALTGWEDFKKELTRLEGGFEKWSRDIISVPKPNELPRRPL